MSLKRKASQALKSDEDERHDDNKLIKSGNQHDSNNNSRDVESTSVEDSFLVDTNPDASNENVSRVNPANLLTEELLLEVFSWLSLENIHKCMLVSKKWNRVANDNNVSEIFMCFCIFID